MVDWLGIELQGSTSALPPTPPPELQLEARHHPPFLIGCWGFKFKSSSLCKQTLCQLCYLLTLRSALFIEPRQPQAGFKWSLPSRVGLKKQEHCGCEAEDSSKPVQFFKWTGQSYFPSTILTLRSCAARSSNFVGVFGEESSPQPPLLQLHSLENCLIQNFSSRCHTKHPV